MGHRRSLTAFHCAGCLLLWPRARCFVEELALNASSLMVAMKSAPWSLALAVAPAWSAAAPVPSPPLAPAAPPPASAAALPASPAPLPASNAVPERLTIEQAVRVGLARNPQMAASQAAAAAAQRNYRSLASFPTLTRALA